MVNGHAVNTYIYVPVHNITIFIPSHTLTMAMYSVVINRYISNGPAVLEGPFLLLHRKDNRGVRRSSRFKMEYAAYVRYIL